MRVYTCLYFVPSLMLDIFIHILVIPCCLQQTITHFQQIITIATSAPTTKMTTTAPINELHTMVRTEMQKALNDKSSFWVGVEWFLDFLRKHVKTFFVEHIKSLPVVGKWTARIGTSVTELIFALCIVGHALEFSQNCYRQSHIYVLCSCSSHQSLGCEY